MRILKPVILLCSLIGILFAGQTGKISGKVTDSQSGEPLIGCNVLIQGTSMGSSTDENGEYFIINLTPGSYDVAFSMIGYASYTAEGVQVNIDVTTPVNAALTTEALQMTGVSVTADRPAIENTLTSSKQIVSGDLAVNLAVTTVNDVVKTLPGVTEEGGELHLRGGRSGEEMYLVDGASVVNPIMGGEAIPVNPSIVGELQLITGTFNAEYGQAMSGLFNTVMKEADDGVHINVSFRTQLGSDYFRETADSSAFKDMDVYSETMEMPLTDTSYSAAVEGADFSKGAFGDPGTVLDATVSVGTGAIGLVASMRQLNNPGRLPGLAEDFSSIQGKLTYQMGSLKLGAEFMSYTRNGFYDPGYDAEKASGAAGQLYAWDWIYALDQYPRTEESTTQFGVSANYVLSSNTNITVRFDNLSKTQTDGAKVGGDGDFIDFVDVTTVTNSGDVYSVADGPNHTREMEDRANSNAWFNLANVYGHYFNSEESHTTVSAYLTSQVNARHLVKAGLESRSYTIDRLGRDVWFGRTVGAEVVADPTQSRIQNQGISGATPSELAVFAQDQMEFNDMIVNVGLRYDAFNVNADDGIWDIDEDGNTMVENTDINPFNPALRRATETKSKLSPRLGVSFPVGDNMAFRYAYGSFFQRPTFYDLLENYLAQMDGGTESGYFVYMGNANLDPQETTIYEMGMQYSLANGIKVDVSGYYKDIANLISAKEVTNKAFVDSSGNYDGTPWTGDDPYQATHFIYKTSEHFGNVRGIEVSVSKSAAEGLSGRMSYTFSIARGTASDKFSAGSLRQETGTFTGNILSMTTLDWHRPHILNGYVDYHTNIGGMFSRVGGNITFNAQSGLPVTARSGQGGASLKERAPSTIDINLRVDAKMNLGVVRPTVYLLIENVMNRRNVVAIADPGSYFDAASRYHEVAAGPTNNLLAYGAPMTMHFGVSIDY